MGQGVGALIMVPLTEFLISRIGWRLAFMATAGLILLAVVPANALLQRRAPQDVGQFPDGDPAPTSEHSGPHAPKSAAQLDWTLTRCGLDPFHSGASPPAIWRWEPRSS